MGHGTTHQHDVIIIGGGGAGLRAAIAIAEENPELSVACVSKVYPMRSHTVTAEGGAAASIKPNDSLEDHIYDTVSGADWLADQDAVEYFVNEAPGEMIQLEHWGCPWSREPDGSVAVRPFGGMKIERTWFAADKTGFHMLHSLFQTTLKYGNIVRYDEHFATKLLIDDDGHCRGCAAIELQDRLDEGDPGQVGHHLHRRGREGLPLHDQRVDQDGRRDGNGLSGRGRAEGHGVHPVSSDGVAGHGHPDHRSLPRRRRHPRQQGRPPLSAGLRTGRSPRRERPQAPAEARDGAGSAGQAQPVLHQGEAGGAHHRDQGRARRASRPPPPRRGQDRQADPVRAGVGAQLRGDRSGAPADPGTAGRALRDGRASTSTATRPPTCRGFTPRASARACRSMGRTGSGRTR